MVFVSVMVHCPIPIDCEKRIEEVIQDVVSWTLDMPVSRVHTVVTILDNELEVGEMRIHVIADFKAWRRVFESRMVTVEKLNEALVATTGGHFEKVRISTQSVHSATFR